MIPEKVNALFQFIDFLHENKEEYIESYLPLVNEVVGLCNKRSELKPRQNYKDKQRYDEIQKTIAEKFSVIKDRVSIPMLNELISLNIWSGDDIVYTSIYNNNINAVSELKGNFTDSDVKEIQKYKQKYLSFRTDTNTDFLNLDNMFSNLDEVLEMLFDYFKDTEANEFEAFEQEVIQVSSIEEAVKTLSENAKNKNGIVFEIGHNKAFFTQHAETKTEQETNLEIFFDSVSKYKAIMEILVSEKLVHADTYIWKDDKKGNKSYLAALIKDLHSKKYYKKNTKPTNEQIVLICKNTFGWEVRIDTIKKAKPSGFDFNFIPLASTIS